MELFSNTAEAFDSVDHKLLTEKLEHYGVKGAAIKLIKSYLKNRKQFVFVNGNDSKRVFVVTGVPPGSALSPFFFLVYVNHLALRSNFDTLMYSNDTVLTISGKTFSNLTEIAEFELSLKMVQS